jgi:hypothetical protein
MEICMGIRVVIGSETGAVIKGVEDPKNLLGRILPGEYDKKFCLLRYIDPYGNTVFNQLQLDDFIAEWRRLRDRPIGPEATVLLDAIENLARECQNGMHQYLTFVGD